MSYIPSGCCGHIVVSVALLFVCVFTTVTADAYLYTGGDWGGKDFSLINGDSMCGSFSNVGRLFIPAGAEISGSADLSITAGSILIDGILSGAPSGYDLRLWSLTDLVLNGSLTSWQSIFLSAQQSMVLNGTISIQDGTESQTPEPGVIRLPDQTLLVVTYPTPTPIPAAAWLFGTGLLGLVGIRRRTGCAF